MSDIRIVSRDPDTGVLSIGISRPPQYVSGIDLVVQAVVLDLLASTGRDIVEPQAGGNLRSLIGSSVEFDDEAEIYAEIRLMVTNTERNIIQLQNTSSRPANEKLARLDLIDVVPDEQNSQVEIILRIVTLDQQDTEAIVGLK